MATDQPISTSPRFSLSMLLLAMAIVAILFGWYTSLRRERAAVALYQEKWLNANLQVQLAESRNELQSKTPSSNRHRPNGNNLIFRNLEIRGGAAAFQQFAFDHADLTDSSLTGGVSSFQAASFKNAILKNAKLVGGGASFQLATFENADLTNAELIGNLQGASLRNAKCVGAKITGSFQAANIDGAQFQNADLSAIGHHDLASCYYEAPPTYNASTKFPAGFDPAAHGWREVSASSPTP